VFLVCFSVVSVSSFDNITEKVSFYIKKWLPEIKHHTQNVAMVIVGTKCDLRDNTEFIENLKKQGEGIVERGKGEDLCKKVKAYSYRECSAKADKGVKEVFTDAVTAGNTSNSGSKEKKGCYLL
jgi:GTPase SAR1 family protein